MIRNCFYKLIRTVPLYDNLKMLSMLCRFKLKQCEKNNLCKSYIQLEIFGLF